MNENLNVLNVQRYVQFIAQTLILANFHKYCCTQFLCIQLASGVLATTVSLCQHLSGKTSESADMHPLVAKL